jgi:hypothetical protein
MSSANNCYHRGLNTVLRGPRSSSFWVPRSLSNHMIRQAHNTMLVKRREITGRTQTLQWWLGGEEVNTLVNTTENKILYSVHCPS